MIKKWEIFVLSLILFLSLASAKITISEPSEIYSLGDKLSVNVDLVPIGITGNFEIDLICSNNTITIYKIPAEPSFSLGEEQQISTYISLTKEYIGNATGNCFISASLGGEEVATKTFTISNSVVLKSSLDKPAYNPGETITLTSQVTKANGKPLNGVMDVSGAQSFTKVVEDGEVVEKFAMPDTIESGKYTIQLFIYDKSESGEILNNIKQNLTFKINQVATSIEPLFSNTQVNPGEKLKIGGTIYDQSGIKMPGKIELRIINPDKTEIQRSVESGNTEEISFPLNATAGTWKVISLYEDITKETEFQVNAIAKAQFEFADSILIVKNIGNTLYNKTINVKIGNQTKELHLNIKIGEERRFNLKAPQGEYDVIVSDGSEQAKSRVLLTGNVIALDDLNKTSILKDYIYIWVFVVLLLIGIITIAYFKITKKKFNLKDRLRFTKKKLKSGYSENMNVTNRSPESISLDDKKEKEMVDMTKEKNIKSESTLVLNGEKASASVLNAKIKNYSELNEETKKQLMNITESVNKRKGAVDIKEDIIRIIYSPILTKTFKNELLASKTGFELLEKIKEYNKKSRQKIQIGIGINTGDLIVTKEDKKLKYTSVGNIITFAKKLSELAVQEILVSDVLHKKLIRDLKVEKKGEISQKPYFSVVGIADKAANAEKLRDLMKRMKD